MQVIRLFIAAGVCLFGALYAQADDLLVFGADWCPSCVALKAVLAKQPELADGYDLVIIDVDLEPAFAAKYAVKAVPVLVILHADGTIRRTVGFTGVENLKQWLQKNAKTTEQTLGYFYGPSPAGYRRTSTSSRSISFFTQ